jgi:hypothetical protein
MLPGIVNNCHQIHVVCSPVEEFPAINTAYLPDEEDWNNNFRTKKKS